MLVIPAIDIRRGRTVRLKQGSFDQEKVFEISPAEAARRWQELGATYLHVVDLDGAFEGAPRNLDSLSSIINAVSVPVQFGGGLRREETIEKVLALGVERAVVGTRALQSFGWLASMCERFPHKLALGLDVREGKLALKGWQELSTFPMEDLLAGSRELPLAAVIFTNTAKDGMLEGPDLAGIEEVCRLSPKPVIASGGVTNLEDIRQLKRLSLAGIIIGRALYEGTIRLNEAIAAAS